MNFYPHFIGDYASDTADLSLLEHGAYRVMLDHYYAQRGDMPADLLKLERVCKARSSVERQAVQEVANRFFPINGDGRRHNKRADVEIAKAKAFSESHRMRANKRWHVPGNAGEMPPHMPDECRIDANHNHNQGKEEKTTDANASVGRGDAALDCPIEKLVEIYHELLPACPRVARLTPARKATLRARWRDEARPNREKHAGYATVEEGIAYWRRFFGWVAQSNFLTGNGPDRNGSPPFLATLAWLSKAENFAKVIEGNYHR